jgi:hypothetical protein
LAPSDLERVVHPQVVRLERRVVRVLGVAQVGVEGERLAAVVVGAPEVVQHEVERHQPLRVEAPAGLDVVVGEDGVGEAVALLDQDGALEAEQPAHRDADEQRHQRDVEEQVAGLAQVAALGADAGGGADGPPAAQLGAAASSTWSGAASVSQRSLAGIRASTRGTCGGGVRSALACSRIRGPRQPISETNSSR